VASLQSVRSDSALVLLLRRILAVTCLGLVVTLGAAGNDAGLHEALHAADSGQHHEEGCAVDLFASGVEQLGDLPRLVRLPDTAISLLASVAEPAMPAKPAGLHPPGRGPPLK
jgi:hypothetical protein